MLEQITFTGRELLVAVILATLVYLVETLIFSRRKSRELPSRMEERLADMEKALADLRSRLEHLEIRPPAGSALDGQSSVHAEAVRLAREGAAPQDMADQLGISRSEAELIVALHRVKP